MYFVHNNAKMIYVFTKGFGLNLYASIIRLR